MDKEEKIQLAMEKSQQKWDDLYSQDQWDPKEIKSSKTKDKHRRIGGGFASKALKNCY